MRARPILLALALAPIFGPALAEDTDLMTLSRDLPTLWGSCTQPRVQESLAIDSCTLILKAIDAGLVTNIGVLRTPSEMTGRVLDERGRAYEAMGDKAAALRDYTASIQALPTYTRTLQDRAELYRSSNDLQAARQDFQQILRIDPGDTVAQTRLLQLGQPAK